MHKCHISVTNHTCNGKVKCYKKQHLTQMYNIYILYNIHTEGLKLLLFKCEAPLHELFPRASFTRISLWFKANIVFPCTSLRGSWPTCQRHVPKLYTLLGYHSWILLSLKLTASSPLKIGHEVRQWLGESPPWRNRPWVSCNYCSRWNLFFFPAEPGPKSSDGDQNHG